MTTPYLMKIVKSIMAKRALVLACAVFCVLAVRRSGLAESKAGPTFPDTLPGDQFILLGYRDPGGLYGFGWGHDEYERFLQRTFRWIEHLEAELYFEVEKPVDTTIWIDAMPMFAEGRRQNMGLYANGNYITNWVFAVTSNFQTCEGILPAETLHAGRNTLLMRVGYRVMPRTRDKRYVALAVDRLLLRPKTKE
ncbi:MAG: hypothetical protein KJ626_07280 [Verrucomicrobia bacterium]|nr:hypothetical protein [Verrucomicrobiota bacterium]